MVPIHLFSVTELLLTGCSPAEPVSSSFRRYKVKKNYLILQKKSPKFYYGIAHYNPFRGCELLRRAEQPFQVVKKIVKNGKSKYSH